MRFVGSLLILCLHSSIGDGKPEYILKSVGVKGSVFCNSVVDHNVEIAFYYSSILVGRVFSSL